MTTAHVGRLALAGGIAIVPEIRLAAEVFLVPLFLSSCSCNHFWLATREAAGPGATGKKWGVAAPLEWGLHPRVAVMNNGTRKGGEPEVMKTVHSSPGPEDSLADALLALKRGSSPDPTHVSPK